MAIQKFHVSDSIPFPARNLVSFIQSQLKILRPVAEKLVHNGAVRVNRRLVVQNHYRLEVDDQVEIDYIPQPTAAPKKSGKASSSASSVNFEVLFDDEDIIVVNKPAGLLTVPTPYRENRTLIGLIDRYQERRRAGRVYCVHRLDRGVSGVLVFAKSLAIAEQIRNQFAARKPARVYAAIVAGCMSQKSGTFRSYLATDKDLNRYSTDDQEAGQLAITHWEVQTTYTNATLLKVQLETGRRNQIRVHLAEAGHPILGDPRYESQLADHGRWPYKRIALHAESLSFAHPRTQQNLQFQTEWPQEFRTFHRQMNGGRR